MPGAEREQYVREAPEIAARDDVTPEEYALLDALERRQPIDYGVRLIEVHYEAGKRVRTVLTVTRSVVEKFRNRS